MDNSRVVASTNATMVPEHLPGEPVPPRINAWSVALRILGRTAALVLLAITTASLWPLYWLGTLVWGKPPNVPKLWQVKRYLRLTWTCCPRHPGLSLGKRCLLTIAILTKVLFTPVLGLAWFLDELLFGKVLNSTQVVAPVIEISAGRSGSTQLARYLEDDPSRFPASRKRPSLCATTPSIRWRL